MELVAEDWLCHWLYFKSKTTHKILYLLKKHYEKDVISNYKQNDATTTLKSCIAF